MKTLDEFLDEIDNIIASDEYGDEEWPWALAKAHSIIQEMKKFIKHNEYGDLFVKIDKILNGE